MLGTQIPSYALRVTGTYLKRLLYVAWSNWSEVKNLLCELYTMSQIYKSLMNNIVKLRYLNHFQ